MRKLLLALLYTLCLIPYTFSQWNASPSTNTGMCVQSNNQQDVRIVTDGKAGAIVTWADFRNDVLQKSGDIFVQRIDKKGINKWTANGVAVCADANDQATPSLVEDGNGGAIIAWNDFRSGNRDIYAQKIDSTGAVQWTANGISVAVKASQQQDAKLISDGAGGAILVWQDSANGAWDIYVQRISSAGAIVWTAGGVWICAAADAQINPRIETDGAGGAILVWQDKRNTVDYDIYAQRINSSGAVQWAANGVAVCTSISTQSNPKIEPDGSGGVIIAWQDKRNGLDYNVYAQRLNTAGAVQWTANGVSICTAAGPQSAVDMTSEGISGAIITWKDMRGVNYDIYAQKVNLSGVVQWTASGIGIVTGGVSQLNPNVVGDGSGGAIIVWQDSSATNSDVKSQRVDGNGVVQWTVGGVLVGSAAGNQVSPKNVSDGTGGCIYAWQDERNTTDFDIYAHHFYKDGTTVDGISEHIVYLESKCFPNPFSESAFIEFETLDNSSLIFSVYDLIGTKVEIPFTVAQNGIRISKGDVTDGIYFYEIRMSDRSLSKGKLILVEKR